jgi:hypothetical protein
MYHQLKRNGLGHRIEEKVVQAAWLNKSLIIIFRDYIIV